MAGLFQRYHWGSRPPRSKSHCTRPHGTSWAGLVHSFQGDKDNRFRKRKAGPQRMPEPDRHPAVPMPSLTRWGTEALKRTISLMTLNEFSTLLSTCSLSLGLECFAASTWLVSGCKRAPLVSGAGPSSPERPSLALLSGGGRRSAGEKLNCFPSVRNHDILQS